MKRNILTDDWPGQASDKNAETLSVPTGNVAESPVFGKHFFKTGSDLVRQSVRMVSAFPLSTAETDFAPLYNNSKRNLAQKRLASLNASDAPVGT